MERWIITLVEVMDWVPVSDMQTVTIIMEFYKEKGVAIETLGLGEVGLAASIVLITGTKGKRQIASNSQISIYLGIGKKTKVTQNWL